MMVNLPHITNAMQVISQPFSCLQTIKPPPTWILAHSFLNGGEGAEPQRLEQSWGAVIQATIKVAYKFNSSFATGHRTDIIPPLGWGWVTCITMRPHNALPLHLLTRATTRWWLGLKGHPQNTYAMPHLLWCAPPCSPPWEENACTPLPPLSNARDTKWTWVTRAIVTELYPSMSLEMAWKISTVWKHPRNAKSSLPYSMD